MKNQNTNKALAASSRFWRNFWIGAGLVALLGIGILIGALYSHSGRPKKLAMSDEQCSQLASEIIFVMGRGAGDAGRLRALNDIYATNCAGRAVNVEKPAPAPQPNAVPDKMCDAVERPLLDKLNANDENSTSAIDHLNRAQTLADLANRGCPENSERYKELALREIEIARALNNDNLNDQQSVVEMVETYKKLQMRAEAEKIFEKAKKLTNPAIDFILQIEKIINE